MAVSNRKHSGSRALVVYAALVGATVFWGLSFVATKVALGGLSTYTLIFIRFTFAAVVFAVSFLIRGFPRLGLRQHGTLALLAVFQPVLYFLFETLGLGITSAAKASLIIATIPVAVLLLSVPALGEKITRRKLGGSVLSVLGVAVLVLGNSAVGLETAEGLLGDLFILGAVVAAALYIILTRSLSRSISSFEITGFQFIYGCLLFVPIYIATAGQQDWSAVTPRVGIALAYLVGVATIGGFLCYNFALSKIEASRASVFLNGVPMVTVVTGWFVLGERVTWIQAIGAVVILAGIYAVTWEGRRAALRRQSEPTEADTGSS